MSSTLVRVLPDINNELALSKGHTSLRDNAGDSDYLPWCHGGNDWDEIKGDLDVGLLGNGGCGHDGDECRNEGGGGELHCEDWLLLELGESW